MMATSALAPSVIDRLDAARALLGCVHVNENVEMKNVSDAQSSSTSNSHSHSNSHSNFNNISNSQSDMDQSEDNMVEKSRSSPQQERRYDWEKTLLELKQAHEQSVSDSSPSSSSPSTAKTKGSGLDALAMLAMSATSIAGHGGDDDVHQNQSDDYETSSNYMSSRDSSPVVRGRARSASCPEGMDRWDAYGRSRSQQMHFTEPMISTILEEHQNHNHNHSAASVVTQDQDMEMNMNDGHEYFSTSAESSSPPFTSNNLPFKKRGKAPTSSPYDSSAHTQSQNPPPLDLDDLNSVAMSICSFANRTHSRRPVPTLNNNYSSSKNNNTSAQPQPQPQAQPAVIESPAELLRRTRARLLEDLNESNNGPNGEKGALKMPHLLNKYKEMYNKNGRIGIYTPDERAAIIAKFNSKRTRRVWNKKIRYNCRKDLADRRVRVKGRFVKRSSEEAAAAKTASPTATTQAPEPGSNTTTTATATAQTKAVTTTKHKPSTPPPGSVHTSTSNSPSPSPPPGPLPTVSESEAMDHDHDHVVEETNEMDITDKEEAGYLEPTEDQPFRRTRRYTIT